MTSIPRSHPRYESLLIRERLVRGFDHGLVAKEGLLAHGRGEAFDYLLGENTCRSARRALEAAAARLLLAENPVISVNGNAAALCPGELVGLSRMTGAKLEVNLFYASQRRRLEIARTLKESGAGRIYGTDPARSVRLDGTDSARRTVDRDGMHAADVVLVPLEDGDRTAALRAAGKTVIAFDLNPLSRTARCADISIIDNITRGMAVLTDLCAEYSAMDRTELEKIACFDNAESLASSIREIGSGLHRRAQECTSP